LINADGSTAEDFWEWHALRRGLFLRRAPKREISIQTEPPEGLRADGAQ